MKGREKKADGLGTPGPKKQHSDEFPEFSCSLAYLRLCAGKAGNLEMPTDTNKKKKAPMKSLLSLVKDKGRTHLQESKRLENNTWLQLKITKNTVTPAPPMTGKGQVEF